MATTVEGITPEPRISETKARRPWDWRGKALSLFTLTGFELHRLPRDDRADYVRLFGERAVRERRFYNIGAGGFSHPCWTNVDSASDWYSGVQRDYVQHDLMGTQPLPIPNGSAEIIYSSHTIEHIKDAAAFRLIREAHRALRPGGILRITCPDVELCTAALLRGDEDWFYWDRSVAQIEQKWLRHIATELAEHDDTPAAKLPTADIRKLVAEGGALDKVTGGARYRYDRPGNHVSWWNADKLIGALGGAGFRAYRSGYGQSACHVLRNTRYFDNTHPAMSLYVEAVR